MQKLLSHFKKRLDQNGMSLLETVIAMGMMGALAVGTMKVLEMGQKGNRKNELRAVASQLSGQIGDYFNSKYVCSENISAALTGQSIKEGKITGELDDLKIFRRNEEGQIISEEDYILIAKTGEPRPDGLFVEQIQVVFENIVDYEENSGEEISEDWPYNKQGNGRIFIRASYCPKGGIRCAESERRSIDKSIPLKNMYAVTSGNTFVDGECDSSQEGILSEAKREAKEMVDEVRMELCKLKYSNAAMNGGNLDDPECGSITVVSKEAEFTSQGSGTFRLPPAANLDPDVCILTSYVPGSLQIDMIGGGAGGADASTDNAGKGGKAGAYISKKLTGVSAGSTCNYTVGKGGSGESSPGGNGTKSEFSCDSDNVYENATGGQGQGRRGDNGNGTDGENSEYVFKVKNYEGGGGRGHERCDGGGSNGHTGGGGGGGRSQKTGMFGSGCGSSNGFKGGDGALRLQWREYTINPPDGLCGCDSPNHIRDENGNCSDPCPNSGAEYDASAGECVCAEGYHLYNGSCTTCPDTQYDPIGSEWNGYSCSCPSGQMTCHPTSGDSYCYDPLSGMTCDNGGQF